MPSLASTATAILAALLAASQLAAAHMEISYPPPFRSKFNPHATNIDYSMTAPLSGDGSNYPCKGYQADMGTPAGAPTASFAPGGTYNFTVTGGAAHGGGSCQASLSYDGGKTFTVIKSIIGGCPLSSNYDFTVPSDAQTGTAIWAWTWQNEIGNREFYMNCAAVTIGGGSAKRDEIKERAVAFSSRPPIFLANLGNGCKTQDSTDVVYPNPGPDVQNTPGKQAPPVGSCGSAAAPAPAPAAPAASAPAPAPVAPAPTTAAQAPPAPAPTTAVPPKATSVPGGVFITVPTTAAQPTTMQTATKASSAAAPPPPANTAGSGSGSSSPASSGGGGGNMSGPCTNEGAWNCISGTAFQRCASGAWSAVISMAAGTQCTPGVGDTLVMRRGIRGARRA